MAASGRNRHLPPAAANRTRILALDYGTKRIGLALSDELGLTARPAGVLERSNRRADIERLRQIAREHGVRGIVIGLPLHLDGRPSEMSQQVRRFGARLEKHLGLPVEFVDERLTSWAAGRSPRAGQGKGAKPAWVRPGAKRASKQYTRDARAAAMILEDYLEQRPASGTI